MAPLNAGDLAPDFELLRDGGGIIRLSDLRGACVVVYFYPKDDTAGCTQQAIDFTQRQAEFRALGAQIIGISPNGVKSHDKFRAKHQLSIILAADEERQAITAYDVWAEKKDVWAHLYGRRALDVSRR